MIGKAVLLASGVMFMCGSVALGSIEFELIRAQPVSPDTVASVLQHGGTAALIGFMFWLLRDERKKTEKYETERVALLKEVIDAVNKITTATAESGRVLERVVDSADKIMTMQNAVMIELKVPRGG